MDASWDDVRRECLPAIEARLGSVIDALPAPAPLREAMRYALVGGGKRLRPTLAWHSAIAVGGRGLESLDAGAAVEMVHAFSLVHDDLPALDNDDVRRGRPTLHKHAGEAMAILAGDQLLTHALLLLASRREPASLGTTMVRELADAASCMIRGQVYDTLGGFEPGIRDPAALEETHRLKTGALIVASCRLGAIAALGSSDHPALDAITTYGRAVGLMFQVVDDLLDVEQSSEQVGKRTRKDAAAGKRTYPSLLGMDGSRREVERLRAEARGAVSGLGGASWGLSALADLLASRRT